MGEYYYTRSAPDILYLKLDYMAGESRFQDFLVYIQKFAICVKNSDGRGRFKNRKDAAENGAPKQIKPYGVVGFGILRDNM